MSSLNEDQYMYDKSSVELNLEDSKALVLGEIMGDHLTDEQFAEIAAGEPISRSDGLHLDSCPACQDRMRRYTSIAGSIPAAIIQPKFSKASVAVEKVKALIRSLRNQK